MRSDSYYLAPLVSLDLTANLLQKTANENKVMTEPTWKPRAVQDINGGVESVERALRLLDAFDMGDNGLAIKGLAGGLALKELAGRTGLSKATILRLSVSLEKFGYLKRDDDGAFHLGPSLWRLGSVYRHNLQLDSIVRPVLNKLVEKTNESASFHVLRGESGVCLYCANPHRRMRDNVEEGGITVLNIGSTGQVLDAFSSRKGPQAKKIREQGYYIGRGERDPEIAGIAAPILGPEGELVGVIALSGLISRFTENNMKSYLETLLAVAREVCIALGSE